MMDPILDFDVFMTAFHKADEALDKLEDNVIFQSVVGMLIEQQCAKRNINPVEATKAVLEAMTTVIDEMGDSPIF